MADASFARDADRIRIVAAASVAVGELRQLADGRAAVYAGQTAATSGTTITEKTSGQYVVTKTAGVVILDGGRVYWDYSANAATYRKTNDRDFYVGRSVGDAASVDTSLTVNLNVDPPYDVDIARDPFVTATVGTQALGGLLPPQRRGGAHLLVLDATNEAQKVDALSLDGWDIAANAIVEFAFCVPSDGAGTVVDVSIGMASGTHATDADSIAQHCFMHLDANATAIKFQSKDGTTTVAATDSTKTYTEGQTAALRKEVWMDMRTPADVQIYVDGVLVLGSTVFSMAAATALYLLAHIEKTSSTDTYTFQLDWLRARFAEQ